MKTPSFSLPHNPRLDDENRESFICSQEAKPFDGYDDSVHCVDCEFKDDMYYLATDLFDEINYLRNEPNPCSIYYEIWA